MGTEVPNDYKSPHPAVLSQVNGKSFGEQPGEHGRALSPGLDREEQERLEGHRTSRQWEGKSFKDSEAKCHRARVHTGPHA